MGLGLLGLRTKKIVSSKLHPGDHIYTARNKKTYFHYGIYIGGQKVIHFTKVSSHNHARPKDKCDHYPDTTKDDTSGVRMCCLECFLQGRSLYRFEYDKGILAIVSSTRSARECDDPDIVVDRARKFLKRDNFGEYSLPLKNCEMFAYFCKTGDKFHPSKQVVRAGVLVGVLAVGGLIITAIGMSESQNLIPLDENLSDSEVGSPRP